VTEESSTPLLLGRYALYEKIAAGGMASVHIGRLMGPVGFARTVAIKRMHPQFAEDPSFVSMFLDEARLAARIRHPNVVPTLDVVAMASELFLVMDFVQGESLARLMRAASDRDERIPYEMVSTLMVGVLHGLHAAHEAKSDRGEPLGIVHRDVSPQNILVGVDGAPRVLDFGVAKAMGRLATTGQGQLKGKLGYMAPEQIRGKVTRQTDVYAASIVMWEALTGTRLFTGDNEGELLHRVLEGTKVPPSAHAPGLPAALDQAVMRGLELNPAHRYATAREMARALEDAIPLVAPSKIGEWVEATAHATITVRSDRVAAIESDSSLHAPAGIEWSADSSSKRFPVAPPGALVDPLVPIHETSTQLSSGGSLPAGVTPFFASRRARTWIAVGVFAVTLTVILVAFAQRAALTFSSPTAPPSPAAPPPTPASEPAATPAAPPETAATPAPPLPPAANATPAASATTTPTQSRSVRAAPVRPAAPKAQCKLVKTLDSNGEAHFSCPCASCE